MSREPGPREKPLRDMREATFEQNQEKARKAFKADRLAALDKSVAEAAKKTGKSRKAKK